MNPIVTLYICLSLVMICVSDIEKYDFRSVPWLKDSYVHQRVLCFNVHTFFFISYGCLLEVLRSSQLRIGSQQRTAWTRPSFLLLSSLIKGVRKCYTPPSLGLLHCILVLVRFFVNLDNFFLCCSLSSFQYSVFGGNGDHLVTVDCVITMIENGY